MDKPEGRRGSEVLDAIFDKLEEKPEQDSPAALLFRSKALKQLDVAAEVDTRLPLVSRRSWLLLVGVALLVAAFALWASLTPSITSVSAQGRVMSTSGALPVVAANDGQVISVAATGTPVMVDGSVAEIMAPDGPVTVRTAVAGTVWQQLAVPGQTVSATDPVLTLLPPGSSEHVVLPVPEGQAAPMVAGMHVDVTAGQVTSGVISALSGPLSAQLAGQRTGMVLPADSTYVLVTVDLATPLEPGAAASGVVVLSEGTVLNRLLDQS